MFSILIPSWNNLAFLKLCVSSIRKNSSFKHQIIVHVNEGNDGTLQWVKDNGITFSYTPKNEGVCVAVNMAAKLVEHDYVVFMNDDMYVLPGWDIAFLEEIKTLNTDCFMLSGTMIEPYDTRNKCVLVANYGRHIEDFEEERLLHEFNSYGKNDWSGATWPPSVVHINWWKKVGGYSEEFSPGMGSDNDFSMKMWAAGCRVFKGLGKSRVYHFISKSTGRVVKNDGKKQFLEKWHLKQSTFDRYYLRRGAPYTGVLAEPGFSVGLIVQKILAKMQIM